MRVNIDFRDGHYSFIPCPNGKVEISEQLWQDYMAYCEQSYKWYNIIMKLDNDCEG